MIEHLGESTTDPSDRVSSAETAQLVISTFEDIRDILARSGVRGRGRGDKLQYQVGYPAFWNVEHGSPEYDELAAKPFTSLISVRFGEDIVGSAEVIQRLPSSVSRRDDWHARFMLPKSHTDVDGQPNGRRVVLDLWQVEYSSLDEASHRLGRDELGVFYSEFLKKQSSGIPAGATNKHHFVFGREEEISAGQHQMVEDILSYFQEACPPAAEAA